MQRAEQLAQNLVSQYPSHPFAWKVLGAVYSWSGNEDKAIVVKRQSVILSPSDPEVHCNLGNSLKKQGYLDEAERTYKKAIELDKNHSRAFNNLGDVLTSLGRLKEAELNFREALRLDPNFAEAHNNLGNILKQYGRLNDAEQSYLKAINVNQHPVMAYNNLGNLYQESGDYFKAEVAYKEAIKHDPLVSEVYVNLGALYKNQLNQKEALKCFLLAVQVNSKNAAAYNGLGTIFEDLGDFFKAEKNYEKAIFFNQELPEPHFNLGNVLFRLGEIERAKASFRAAIRHAPHFIDAYCNLGNILLVTGDVNAAERLLSEGVRRKPASSAVRLNLGNVLLQQGKLDLALELALESICLVPDINSRLLVANVLKKIIPLDFSEHVALLCVKALEESWARPAELLPFAQQLIFASAGFKGFTFSEAVEKSYLDLEKIMHVVVSNSTVEKIFELVVTSGPVSNIDLEYFLSYARRTFLEVILKYFQDMGDIFFFEENSDVKKFLSLISQQCFINEYIFPCTTNEEKLLLILKEFLEIGFFNNECISEIALLLVSCYCHLYEFRYAERLLVKDFSEYTNKVLKQQVQDHFVELALAGSIPQTSKIIDPTSLAVKAQYESNPYPRWVRIPRFNRRKTINSRLRELFPYVNYRPYVRNSSVRLLVIGCGTGQQPLEIATLYDDCEVVAIDLSLSSLAYAKRKARENAIDNITFLQGDIMNLGLSGEKFDVIFCSGVLHHTDNPFKSWEMVLPFLHPDGFMSIGLYSFLARRKISKLRDSLSQSEFSASSLQTFREVVKGNVCTEEFNWLLSSSDFFSASNLRDLVFHVKENPVTLLEIQNFLNTRQLRFLGFELDQTDIIKYRTKFPEDVTATNLNTWNTYESQYPDTFCQMYQFWVQRP